ncbi:hypothetical protein ILUMI_21566 [Ignelater luminosus]|uniref:Uncharacterized protein n=1 Tax=Ignelater luminosus TaxID=2038154 RepID=A0A8K0CII2_IGNLU|nr:hypothetical protein ILUMI_21566 [Ignelater luminosus]
MKSAIKDSKISIVPSHTLISYIDKMENCEDMPDGVKRLRLEKVELIQTDKEDVPYCSLITNEECEFLKCLDLDPTEPKNPPKSLPDCSKDSLLRIKDLMWVWNKMQQDKSDSTKMHLHELLSGCELIYPQNEEIPRSEELDRRCNLLKRQQENREYKAMTKNVDNIRKTHPENTIAYQLKQLNRQGLAVIQFIITVLSAFAFGLEGVQLMIGPLQFGFRLLLGIIFGLIVALAEIYFLAKKLNEDNQQETEVEDKTKHAKMD